MTKQTVPPAAYALVAFNLPIKDSFIYEIPSAFREIAEEGMRVVAPFGRQRLTGYVVGMTRRVDENLRLKVLEDFPDSRPAVSRELLKLTRWVADYYHASWGEAIKAAIPPGLEAISGETYVLTETGEQILAQGTADKLVLPVLRWIAKNPRAMASQARRVFGNKVTRLLAIAMEKTWVKTSFKLKKTTAAYITKKKYKVLLV